MQNISKAEARFKLLSYQIKEFTCNIFNQSICNFCHKNHLWKNLGSYLPPAIVCKLQSVKSQISKLWSLMRWCITEGKSRETILGPWEIYIIVASHHTTLLLICHTMSSLYNIFLNRKWEMVEDMVKVLDHIRVMNSCERMADNNYYILIFGI